ncbi:MAG TPA: prevent-host-death protein [Erysipelotrichaceae bacterium]|jgi:prevent-host-death family protein|nr:type II toxin-antitoxin system Phd/YefM family antitoxin [Bacillota bacterium]HCY07072.1 prevent-host-death protein [Erysipelotrichaceae bacterium]
MPVIKSSTDLRNNYNEISNFCNETDETVFITKNGRGDLAVMSIETYERLVGKNELYLLLEESEKYIGKGEKKPLKDVISALRKEIKHEKI